MIVQPYRLYVERRDAGRNMARFYAISIEETLFGQPCLIRRWGRIGTRGRTIQHLFEEESEAVDLFLELLAMKKRRGYRPRSGFRHAEAAPPFGGAIAGRAQKGMSSVSGWLPAASRFGQAMKSTSSARISVP